MTVYSRRSFDGIDVLVLDRLGGVSTGCFESLNLAPYVGDDSEAVQRNLQIAAELSGTPHVAYLRAEHGSVVHFVSEVNGVQELPLGDGAVITNPNIGLIALSADCVAGALVDPVHRVVGVFHAGWKGVVAQVAAETFRTMQVHGATADTTRAVLGPSICGNCYEVDTERVNQFRQVVPEAVIDDRHIDVRTGVQRQLEFLGINVDVIPGCTYENEDLFSYRRANGEPTGRGGLIVSMQTGGSA